MGKFVRFFGSKQFLFNAGAIALVWVIIIQLDKWYLKRTTHLGQRIEVPSFYKVRAEDLDAFTSGKRINYKVVDSIYVDGWPKGTVCWQYPRPTASSGMGVKEGRTVELSIVPLLPEKIVLPDVRDMSKRMGEMTLSAMGMRTKVTYKAHSYASGFILDQLYKGSRLDSGTSLPKGSRIELVVSRKE